MNEYTFTHVVLMQFPPHFVSFRVVIIWLYTATSGVLVLVEALQVHLLSGSVQFLYQSWYVIWDFQKYLSSFRALLVMGNRETSVIGNSDKS
jgi:hypothetical protein